MGTNTTSTNPKRAAGRIALRVLLAAALAALLLPASALWAHHGPERAWAATATLNVGRSIGYAGYSTNYMSVDGAVAYCAQPSKPTPSSGSYAQSAIRSVHDDRLVAGALYFGFDGPGFDPSIFPSTWYDGSAMNDDRYLALTHIVVADFYAADGNAAMHGCNAAFKSWCEQHILAGPHGVHNPDTLQGRIQDKVYAGQVPETFLSNCFELNTGGSTQVIVSYVKGGYVELSKASANPDITLDNGCYSLAGAVYGIYSDPACTRQVATMTTNSAGYAKSPIIQAGRYYVKEVTPPKGYALDLATYPVTVGNAVNVKLSVTDIPQNDPAAMWVGKIDLETTLDMPEGSASLDGAEYTVRYYDGLYDSAAAAETSGEPTRTWVVKTNENGCASLLKEEQVSGDELYYDSAGNPTLPLGTYLIQETKAPEGYLLGDDTVFVRTVTQAGDAENVETYDIPIHPEQVKRGDLMLVKAAEDTSHRLANVPFKITSLTTGESHVLVTDANGEAKTCADWNAHTESTNANDEALNEDGTVDASKLDARAGIWFGTSEPDNGHGALIYDDYKVEELRVPANKGYELVVLPKVSIARDGYTVNIGTLDDRSMQVSTAARDGKTGSKAVAAEPDASIIDRVDYRYATPGRNYTLKTWAQVYEDDERLLDANGEAIVIETPFAAVEADGYVEVEIPFDATTYDSKHIVVFEQVLDTDGNVVASHEDIDDPAQTVVIGEEDGLLPKTGSDNTALKGLLIALATVASLVATGAGANLYLRRKDDEKAAS